MSNAEDQARHKAKRVAEGLKRIEIWVPVEMPTETVKKIIADEVTRREGGK